MTRGRNAGRNLSLDPEVEGNRHGPIILLVVYRLPPHLSEKRIILTQSDALNTFAGRSDEHEGLSMAGCW